MNESDRGRTKLWDMIRKYRFAMMTTREGDEALRSRPMTTIEREYDGSLWFFAKADSSAAAALEAHPGVCLTYSDSEQFDFVSVAGEAVVVTDPIRKQELWKPAVQAWFPAGPDSDDSVLIKVMPQHAEYWDSSSNRLVKLFSMAKAIATRTQPKGMGEHRNVPVGAASGAAAPGAAPRC